MDDTNLKTINEIELIRNKLENSLNQVVDSLGKIQIGSISQFPYGWRKAAKGRTVWRVLEEAISQNLECRMVELGFESLNSAESEVGVYDFYGQFSDSNHLFFVNIKSAVVGARTNKDDISKARKLLEFYEEDLTRKLFTATFLINFNSNMSVEISKAIVMPTSWIPDVYVNPSNNGNLQSSKYKDLSQAARRTNQEFVEVLKREISVADLKKSK